MIADIPLGAHPSDLKTSRIHAGQPLPISLHLSPFSDKSDHHKVLSDPRETRTRMISRGYHTTRVAVSSPRLACLGKTPALPVFPMIDVAPAPSTVSAHIILLSPQLSKRAGLSHLVIHTATAHNTNPQ